MNVVLEKKSDYNISFTSDFNEAGKKWSIIAPVFLDFSQVYLSYYKECIAQIFYGCNSSEAELICII
ncbi:hypothetical protein T12_16079 [Trichinella patagoniensis]|uniref:Uncharacterized protein n=1 Tax=Trichinella patagoniensis TaxID=990121 RepID=A0A0V1AGG0_9BILA|nr:hypothetical protein T12_16079 [Trichinella patagoniensis]